MNPINIEEIRQFLSSIGVRNELVDVDDTGFSRTIQFEVYGQVYRIIWFKNMSTLYIGTHRRASEIPFKYMYHDRSYPLAGGNESIGFAYSREEKKSIFDREYPFESFRIPLEIDKKK